MSKERGEKGRAGRVSGLARCPVRTTDPLEWWRTHKAILPVLARVARKFLAIPATGAPSERVWSVAGNVVTKKCARFSDENIDSIVFLHENFKICLEVAEAFLVRAQAQAAAKASAKDRKDTGQKAF